MKKSNLINLRLEAEKKLRDLSATEPGERSPEELLFELQVHQIELEMQNEELRQVQVTLEEAHDRYLDLYDNAPVAYISVSDAGLITQINHAAVELFGLGRKELLLNFFATLVAPYDSDRWYLFCRKLTKNQRLSIELSMRASNDSEFCVQLNCRKEKTLLRITLTDITQIKLQEAAAAAAAENTNYSAELAAVNAAATAAASAASLAAAIAKVNADNASELAEVASAAAKVNYDVATELAAANAKKATATAQEHFDNAAKMASSNAAAAAVLAASIAAAAALKQAELLTEKTLLAKLQKEAFSRLERISSQLPGAVYQFQLNTDGSYCFPYLSAGIQNIFPLSSQEGVEDESKIFAFLHPDDQEGLWASILDSAKNLTPWHYEYRIKLQDGTINWLLGNSLPQREANGSTLWHGFISDITERKQMENALRESEFVCKFAIEGSGDGLWDRNFQTDEITYSKRWKEMLGYTEDDILPNRHEWLNRIHPGDKESVDMAMQAYLKGQSQKYAIEYRLRCKNDDYIWILARGMVVSYDKNGVPLRMIGTHTDISKLKYQEQQSKEHLEQLAHVTRLGLMGEMASGIAHEVNQPLCAVTSYAQVIANLIKKEPLDQVKISDVATKIQEQSLRAGKIIHRMKNFCKSKAQARSTVDINALIVNCVDLCHAELVKHKVQAIMVLDDQLPFIHVDPLQIEQVLINLIRNGCDAFQGMALEKQHLLTLSSYHSLNNTLSISVEDNGNGIEEDLLENIMTPFYTTKTEGMGMGLSICRSLIEAHDGTLLFDSISGKGTTFYFTLPISSKPEANFPD